MMVADDQGVVNMRLWRPKAGGLTLIVGWHTLNKATARAAVVGGAGVEVVDNE